MINPKAVKSYAQYNEDIVLLALLYDVKEGFYVDVGANYPDADSVTKLFYDKGWRGINIEPVKSLYEQLRKERPRDINLQYGVGAEPGTATLREYTKIPGHSTFSEQRKHDSSRKDYLDYDVKVKTLAAILKENAVKDISFMKIDVEGYEYEVVAGGDWQKFRPEVVCIEANHVNRDWRPILRKNDYKLFIADGLNEYYLRQESWGRTDDFAERAIKLNHRKLKFHQLEEWSKDRREILGLRQIIEQQQNKIGQLETLTTLTLKDRPLKSRIKRASYGLTVDWIKYKKTKD